MTCQHCGGLVIWRGLIINLTHTECQRCGATNCQVNEEDHDDEKQDD